MVKGRPAISFETLLEKLATSSPPVGGQVPTYVYLEFQHAKRLASLYQVSQDVVELQTEVRETRRLLNEAMQQMSQLLEQITLQNRSAGQPDTNGPV